MAGLDPAICRFFEEVFGESDGCAGQCSRMTLRRPEINYCGKCAVDDSVLFQSLTTRAVRRRDQLWTARALPVDGLARAVARIPQITSLEPRKLWRGPEIAPCSDASPFKRVSAARVRINTSKGKVETACPCSKASSTPRTIRLRWSRTSQPPTTGRSNAPAKTRSPSSPRATGPITSCRSHG